MDTDFEWSECQQTALEKAYALLGEHFEHVVIVVAGDHMKAGESRDSEAKQVLFKGGFCPALGLLTYAQHRMLHHNPEPDSAS